MNKVNIKEIKRRIRLHIAFRDDYATRKFTNSRLTLYHIKAKDFLEVVGEPCQSCLVQPKCICDCELIINDIAKGVPRTERSHAMLIEICDELISRVRELPDEI
jgi:hypothetical protein